MAKSREVVVHKESQSVTRNSKRKHSKTIKSSKENKSDEATENIRTRLTLSNFNFVVSCLNDHQRQAVVDIGFGSLLHISLKTLNMQLGMWLVQNFEYRRSAIKMSANRELVATRDEVHACLGLPKGDIPVVEAKSTKRKSPTAFTRFMDEWRRGYGVTDRGPMTMVVGEKLSEKSGDDFKRDFVCFTVSTLLSANQNNLCSWNVLYSLMDVSKIKYMDWCEYTLVKLKAAMKAWNKSDCSKKFFNGSLLFLTLFYLDRTSIGAISGPRSFPTISCWSQSRFRDRLKEEKEVGFGTGFINPPLDVTVPSCSAAVVDELPTTDVGNFDAVLGSIQKKDASHQIQAVRDSVKLAYTSLEKFRDEFGDVDVVDTIARASSKLFENLFKSPCHVDDNIAGSSSDMQQPNSPTSLETEQDDLQQHDSPTPIETEEADIQHPDSPTPIETEEADIQHPDSPNPLETEQAEEECGNNCIVDDSIVEMELDETDDMPHSSIRQKAGNRREKEKTKKIEVKVRGASKLEKVPPKPTRFSRRTCPSAYARTPIFSLIVAPVNVKEKFTRLQTEVIEHVISGGNPSDVVFDDGVTHITREEMASLDKDVQVHVHVVDAFSSILNHDNRNYSFDKSERFYFTTLPASVLLDQDIGVDGDRSEIARHRMRNELQLGGYDPSKLKHFHHIFFPCFLHQHYYLVVINFASSSVEVIDNMSLPEGINDDEKYGADVKLLVNFFAAFLESLDDVERSKELLCFEINYFDMPWRKKSNNVDCGIYALRHMESYPGNGPSWNIGFNTAGKKGKADLSMLRRKYAFRLAIHDKNLRVSDLQTSLKRKKF